MPAPLSPDAATRRRYKKTKDLLDEGGAPPPGDDVRTVAESDRDKLIYSSFLRRLAGVTQVVGAREGHIFHNRLTHTLKVAQLSERLAERFCRMDESADLADHLGVDPVVAEAAALAHDLGHPPYGHVAEQTLRKCVDSHGCVRERDGGAVAGDATNDVETRSVSEGFEGNAQSFRIITRLAVHKTTRPGLNLSRGTLNGVLKYPYFRQPKGTGKKHEKWGAYRSDRKDFTFTRGDLPAGRRTVEARIMDVADDIAYSVHDLDDFVRAGLVPLADLLHNRSGGSGSGSEEGERARFTEWWKQSKFVDDPQEVEDNIDRLFEEELRVLYGDQVYRGEYVQRGLARATTSRWIQDMLDGVSLVDPEENEGRILDIDTFQDLKMKFLKGLVWYYVIESRKLATQRAGQKKIVEGLFEIYLSAICDQDEHAVALIPNRFTEELANADSGDGEAPAADELRLAADIVASFTDREAARAHHRLTGVSFGSVTEVVEV